MPPHRDRVANHTPHLFGLTFLLALTLWLSSAATAQAIGVATVLPTDGLNLRGGPGTQHPKLALVPGGARVGITGPETDGWYPVTYRDQSGWMNAGFLDAGPDLSDTPRRASVRPADGLVLRSRPSTRAEQIGLMPAAASVSVSQRQTTDGWVLVAWSGLTGWARTDYLTLEQPSFTEALTNSGANGPISGRISYYHPSLEGGQMACGGRYRAEDATIAAATAWPCGTKLRVCRNSTCVTVTVQDTGHLPGDWVDLSAAAFSKLAPLRDAQVTGTIEVVKD